MAFSQNLLTKIVSLLTGYTIPPVPKYLGQGEFFYLFGGVFLSTTILLCIFWDIRIWLFVGISSLLFISLVFKRCFSFRILIVLIGISLSFILLTNSVNEATKKYTRVQSAIIPETRELTLLIDESLGVKWGRLVLRWYLIWAREKKIEIKILPTNTPPDGITSFRITQISAGSKFQISRGIIAWLEGNVISKDPVSGEKSLKYKFAEIISKTLPYPESALMAGMLTGDARLMDDAFNTRYRLIGLTHLCVVSGSNISFVLINLCIILFFIPFHYRIPLAVTWIIGYIWFVWGDPPVLRAWIMGVIGVFSLLCGKRGEDSVRILILAAVCLVAYSPLSLVYDVGFLLSFFATLGIMVGGIVVKWQGHFTELWSGSIFAAIWTLPIASWVFGTVHSMSIIANILVAPVVGIATVFSCLTLLISPINSFLGYELGHISFLCLAFIDLIAQKFWEFPHQFSIPLYLRAIICLGISGIILGFSLRFLGLLAREKKVDALSLTR